MYEGVLKMIGVKKAIEIAKPFVVKKNPSRPVLRYSLVTPEYVIATDGCRLIRIRHDEPIKAPYLYDYKRKRAVDNASEYPKTERLFSDTTQTRAHFTINVKEWLKIHELAHIAAKPLKHKDTQLKGNVIQVNATDISFKHTLDQNTGVEIAYNCEYMIDTLKAYKKAKIHHVDVYFFGTRPMYFVAGDIEVLLMPLPQNM